ncbi:integrase/recombinase xerD homolog [Podarcis muralis]
MKEQPESMRKTEEFSKDTSLPVACTWSTAVARTLSGVPVERWRRKVIQGVLASVAPSTLRSYKKAWCDFLGFRSGLSGLSHNVPPTTEDVLQYLSHLDDLGRAPKTLKIHVAAISFFSKATFAHDPCGDFLIRRAIEGWGRLQPPRAESRKPISYGLLSQIRKKLRSICWSRFEARLFSAAYAIAFFGALRVGEVVFEVSARGSTRSLLCEDVQLSETTVTVHIRQSKTDQAGKGVMVKLTASAQQGPCPVKDTRRYLYLRPPGPGPFLVHEDGTPLLRHQFTRVLRKAIEACGLSSQEYAAHSFRIGAATTVAHLGLPADRIKEMGRWKSNAYKSYIR